MTDTAAEVYEEPLGDHDRAAFDCGQEDLTAYFRGEEILRQVASHDSTVFVLRVPGDDRVAGYYTMSNAAILRSLLPRKMRDVLRYSTTPALLIGRLARDLQFKGAGIGRELLEKAWKRCIDISERSGCAVLIVDTIDDAARDFYSTAGFVMLPAPKVKAITVECECGRMKEVAPAVPESNFDMKRMYMPVEQVRAALAV